MLGNGLWFHSVLCMESRDEEILLESLRLEGPPWIFPNTVTFPLNLQQDTKENQVPR